MALKIHSREEEVLDDLKRLGAGGLYDTSIFDDPEYRSLVIKYLETFIESLYRNAFRKGLERAMELSSDNPDSDR